MQYDPRFAILMVAALTLPGPARAQDQIIDQPTCDFFCALWRNVSGKAQVSSAMPIDNAARDAAPLPQAIEGAETPQPGRIVQRRGVVVEETAAERAAALKRKRALERETTRHVADGEKMMRKVLGRQDDAAK